jgi:hypothetical protein
MRRAATLLFGTFALAGSLAGCGGHLGLESGGATSEPNLDASVITQADPNSVAQPLATYMFSAADEAVIKSAILLSGNQCMAPFGFSPATSVLTPPIDSGMWARYGLWDPASAQTGYLSPEELQSSSIGFGYPNPSDALSVYTGVVQTYNGLSVPTGGCQAVAFGAVRSVPGVDDLSGFVESLYQEAQRRSMQDSRVEPLLGAWQTCMKQKGWDYSNVLAPFSYWDEYPRRGTEKHLTLASITDAEKASAAADLSCKHSTGLLGTWLAADVAYQGLIVEREAQKLGDWSTGMDKILANAKSVAAGGGPQAQHS